MNPGFGQCPGIFEEDRIRHRADEVVKARITVSKDPQQLVFADQTRSQTIQQPASTLYSATTDIAARVAEAPSLTAIACNCPDRDCQHQEGQNSTIEGHDMLPCR